MNISCQKYLLSGLAGLLAFSLSPAVHSASKCKVKYGWNTGNSYQGTFKNRSKIIYINKGTTKTINKNRMNYVKNLRTRKVKFYLNNASDVTLNKNQRNPVAGTYAIVVKLVKVKCFGNSGSSSSSSSNSSAKKPMYLYNFVNPFPFSVYIKIYGNGPEFPVVRKVPAPPAPFVPIPYPNQNMIVRVKKNTGGWSKKIKIKWKPETIVLPNF